MKEILRLDDNEIELEYWCPERGLHDHNGVVLENFLCILGLITGAIYLTLSFTLNIGEGVTICGCFLIFMAGILIQHLWSMNAERKYNKKEEKVLETMRTEAILNLLNDQ